MDHGFLVAFNQTVGRLAPGGGAHNVGVICGFGEIGLHGLTKEFVVTVCTEVFFKSSGLCTKDIESIADVSGTESV